MKANINFHSTMEITFIVIFSLIKNLAYYPHSKSVDFFVNLYILYNKKSHRIKLIRFIQDQNLPIENLQQKNFILVIAYNS